MKILIIVNSKHRQNTMKIAEAMAEAAPALIVDVENAKHYKLSDFDIVGFGSGIYAGKFDGKIIKLIESLDNSPSSVFVFSTSGTGKYEKYNLPVVNLLESKNKTVLGSFGCKGLCKWFIFALVGGIAKGHPDIEDFEAAQVFIEDMMKRYDELKT